MRFRHFPFVLLFVSMIFVTGASASESEHPDPDVTEGATARFRNTFYEGGLVYGYGGSLSAPGLLAAPGMAGIRVMENKWFAGLIPWFVAGAVLSGASSRYGGGSHGFSLPKGGSGGSVTRDVDKLPSWFTEVTIYPSSMLGMHPDRPHGKGVEVHQGGSIELGNQGPNRAPLVLQIALNFTYVWADGVSFAPGSAPASHVLYANLGPMVRLHVPIAQLLEAYAQWEPNVFGLILTGLRGERTVDGTRERLVSPLSLGVIVHAPHERAYLRVCGVANGFGFYVLSAQAEAGVRF
jgi:hypothetical protein